MGFNFGDINNMTKADFQAAIEYYQNKIAQMEADESINPGAKAWFLKKYNERIQTLQKGFERFQEVVNDLRSRTPSIYVNEKTATINSMLGTTSSSTGSFDNLKRAKVKHGFGQFFRILGAVLLPIVGTIPFTISAVKARRKHQAIKNMIAQENIDMQNFANERRRSYDAALATNTPFTEQEMQELLANPAELQRLTDLTNPTDPTLNPAEKKILASKLATVRAYAQKNGYTIATGSALDNARFNTSADKIRSNPLATPVTPTTNNLKEAHDKIKELENLKVQADALLAADPENDDLKSLVSTIDSNIATLKTQAQGYITAGLTGLNTDLTAAETLNMGITPEDARYKDSNTRLDTAYNNKTRFGPFSSMTVAEARAYAEAIGLDATKFDNAKQKYDNAKNKNNTELQVYNDFDKIYAEAKAIIDTYSTTGFISSLDSAATVSAIAKLNEAQGKLNQLQAMLPNIPSGDSRHTDYISLTTRLSPCIKDANKQANNFKADEQGYSALNTIYTDALTYLTGTHSKAELEAQLDNLDYIITKIDEIPAPRDPKFTQLLQDTKILQGQLESKFSQAEIKNSDFKKYKQQVLLIDVSDKSKHLANQAKLQAILDVIDNDSYKNKFSDVTRNEIDLLIVDIKEKLMIIKTDLEDEKESKKVAEKKADEYKDLLEVYKAELVEIDKSYTNEVAILNSTGRYSSSSQLDKENAKTNIGGLIERLKQMKNRIGSDLNLKAEDKSALKNKINEMISNYQFVFDNALTKI